MRYAPVVVVAFVAGMLALERLFPFSAALRSTPRRARWFRLVKNAAIAGLNFTAAPIVALWITQFAVTRALDWRPVWLADWTWASLVFDLLLLDLWIYAWHRAVHAWPITWRLHQVHHMDEAVDVTTALRFHAGDVLVSSLSRGVVIVLASIPMRHVFLFEVVTILFSTFHHANLRLPRSLARALGWLIITPDLHGLHHHPSRSVHDSNYGTVLSLWDRVFGSLCAEPRTPEAPIGLAGRPDEGLVGLLVRPFHGDERVSEQRGGASD